MSSQAILITGGTGLIGSALTGELLKRGYKVIILTRNPSVHRQNEISNNLHYAGWNINRQEIDPDAVSNVDHIIHLAGAGVADKRWTRKRKKEIVESRVKSSELIVKVLRENKNKVKSVISASAIGWYGPDSAFSDGDPKRSFSEADPSSDDFLGRTAKQWEESIEPVTRLNKRLVKLRTGIVLSDKGGAYIEFKKPLRFGVATILGSGKQMVSWTHIDDLVNMYITAVENENFSGEYNAVAPNPVTNRELILTIARHMSGNFYIPLRVPSFVLKLVLGEMSIEVLKSATVSCAKIQKTGFVFTYPDITSCIKHLLHY